ncbi:hypothetical protein [Streptomyces botrytidirepellens]|uniref:hypothetical protein n=1 Tax=Streptomyces botrytidirepellens TaxID=2486417 RepID=UPI0011CE811C|nr:hypothetical protein [Streptomyces botrytidirepellens]
MDQLLFILPALPCPLGMGAMMWFMMRPGRGASGDPAADRRELARLRKEIQALSDQQTPHDAMSPGPPRLTATALSARGD